MSLLLSSLALHIVVPQVVLSSFQSNHQTTSLFMRLKQQNVSVSEEPPLMSVLLMTAENSTQRQVRMENEDREYYVSANSG